MCVALGTCPRSTARSQDKRGRLREMCRRRAAWAADVTLGARTAVRGAPNMQEGRRSCDGILDVPVPDDGAHGDAFARKLPVNMHILRGRFGELDRNAFRLDLSHF